MMRATLPVLALSLLAGCPDRTIAEVPVGQNTVEVKDIPVTINRDLDILFLIDKSPTMKDEQAALTANFGRFMQILSGIDGGLPNVHVGVISQDIGAGGMNVGGNCSGKGDDGKLLNAPHVTGCTSPTNAYISDTEQPNGDGTTRIRNYTGTLEDEFKCIATLGDVGCGFEQHLGSLEKALFDQPLANKDFLRPNALLAIIIISDEDDCTADNTAIYDPANNAAGPFADFRCFEYGWECDEGTMSRGDGTYTNCHPRENSPYLRYPDALVDRIKALKADPRDIIVSTIIGPSSLTDPRVVTTAVKLTAQTTGGAIPVVQPSCVNGQQNAFPMPRLAYFAQQFENNTFYSLCNDDLGKGLEKIADAIRRRIGNPCFEADIANTDRDPVNPGTQLDCSVSETAGTNETIIPVCKMANATTPAPDAAQPCWYTVPDADRCASYPTKLKLVISPEDRQIPSESHIHAQCITD